ncbi:MAG TPA: histidine phosphatase family protein [Paracoccaceae bacterium]|nr:histidine phosphatase family protein [Paracoccaceae bacterium]
MTRVALMRHYPTAWNAEGRLQGRTDVPLSPGSRALLAGVRLPPPWDGARLFASTLARAAETARLLADGRAVTLDARLVEVGFGDWKGRRTAELTADPVAGFRPASEWGPDDRAPGGESLAEAWARLFPALAEIAAEPMPAVIVTHKSAMRLILRRAGVAEPEIKRGRLYPVTLEQNGRPRDPGPPVRLAPR